MAARKPATKVIREEAGESEGGKRLQRWGLCRCPSVVKRPTTGAKTESGGDKENSLVRRAGKRGRG